MEAKEGAEKLRKILAAQKTSSPKKKEELSKTARRALYELSPDPSKTPTSSRVIERQRKWSGQADQDESSS